MLHQTTVYTQDYMLQHDNLSVPRKIAYQLPGDNKLKGGHKLPHLEPIWYQKVQPSYHSPSIPTVVPLIIHEGPVNFYTLNNAHKVS